MQPINNVEDILKEANSNKPQSHVPQEESNEQSLVESSPIITPLIKSQSIASVDAPITDRKNNDIRDVWHNLKIATWLTIIPTVIIIVMWPIWMASDHSGLAATINSLPLILIAFAGVVILFVSGVVGLFVFNNSYQKKWAAIAILGSIGFTIYWLMR